MFTFSQQLLNLFEGQGINSEIQQYFPQGEWVTSPYFKNQTYEQFYRNLTAFFLLIEKQKNLPISNQQNYVSLSMLFNDQFNQKEFKLQNVAIQMQSAAHWLQLYMRVNLVPSNIVFQYGNKDHQKVKIMMLTLQSEPRQSYIFGLQKQIMQCKSCSQLKHIQNQKKPELKFNIQQQPTVYLDNKQNLVQKGLQVQKQQLKIQQFGNHQPIHAQQVLLPNPQSQPQENNQDQPFQANQGTEGIQVRTTQQISEISAMKLARPIKTKLKLSISKVKQNVEILCDACNERYQESPDQQICLPCCRRIVHKSCMLQELETNQEILSNMKCRFCQKIFEITFLKQNIRSNIFKEKQKELVYYVECCSCSGTIVVFPQQRKQPIRLECKICNTYICSKCLLGFHGSDQLCQENKNKFQRQKTECLITSDGIDSITCDQSKIDPLSVDRSSILQVGNAPNGQGTIIQERVKIFEFCQQTTDNQSSIPNELETNKKKKGF
ncbi:unnamed protein product (macronuclear) [Paramecium tetraurelia]|uniref:RING-type domain-containing protein n=1 Tax=Paramecium tetraurelia TaxID=5888 RepID=A0EIP8_PARTE|nr:uncharacterized protein GSPATT00027518001 [Paramecium tetraurelia]CAK95189.1 unnamed protein product [Paramecium tetraurelia]|eukprot:XP_001462562.1 hypothetical protein (macronuclear) [Paramecium tetraurelia strain d4-2]